MLAHERTGLGHKCNKEWVGSPSLQDKMYQVVRWPRSFWKAYQNRSSMWRASEERQEMNQAIWEERVLGKSTLALTGPVLCRHSAGQCHGREVGIAKTFTPQRQCLEPSPYLWLLQFFLLLLLEYSLSLRVGRINVLYRSENSAINSHGPDGAYGALPNWPIYWQLADAGRG